MQAQRNLALLFVEESRRAEKQIGGKVGAQLQLGGAALRKLSLQYNKCLLERLTVGLEGKLHTNEGTSKPT